MIENGIQLVKIVYDYNYKNGKKNGLCKDYGWDGFNNWVRSEKNYKDGWFCGVNKWFYSNGQQGGEVNYKYSESGYGKISVDELYLDGIYEYKSKKGDKNGQINNKSIKHGVLKNWYENGQLKYEGNYKDGLLDGL